MSYDVEPAQGFVGTVHVFNGRPAPHDYLVTLFVDYHQTSFKVDGDSRRSFVLHLRPREDGYVRFELDPLEPGLHDLSFAVFADPDRNDTSDAFRRETGLFHFASGRVNLRVGPGPSTPRIEETATVLTESIVGPDGSPKPGAETDAPLVNTSKADYELVTRTSTKGGTAFPYYVHVANLTSQPRTFALLPMFDYEQARDGAGAPLVLYVTVPPGRISTLKTAVTVPADHGVHDLQVLQCVSPFSVLTDEGFGDSLMERSLRVAVRAD